MISTIYALIDLLRWIMVQFNIGTVISGYGSRPIDLTDVAARLVVYLPLWLIFWNRAQRLFAGTDAEEHESALRKFYLYATVFVAVLAVVTNATLLLTGFFRSMLGLAPQGELRDVLPGVIVLGAVWAYHAVVLRSDTLHVQEAPRQAGLRRLYRYLVAVVGLAAFLVGLSGDSSVLIRLLVEQSFGDTLREQLAWCTAALLIGLPVWLWPWRVMQQHALVAGAAGMGERQSGVRKAYLYFFLFVATLTVLSGLIYIVYRVVSLLLGEQEGGNLASDIAQAAAFAIIAAAVWIYHSLILRTDGQLNEREQAQRLAEMHVAVVDGGDGHFGSAVLDGLRRELPGLVIAPIGLTPAAALAMGQNAEMSLQQQLAEAALIIGATTIVLPGEKLAPGQMAALLSSPAHKLLIPVRNEDWDWVGVERWSVEDGVRQTIHAVKQIVAGEDVKPIRPMSAATIIGRVIVVVLLLILLANPLLSFLTRF